jgi:glycosyltransferase involved in cell wall biosynthesis
MAARISSLTIRPIECREFVARRFSVGRMADRYLEVYERALKDAAEISPAGLST